MLNQKVLVGAIVGLLVLGWFLFLKPSEIDSPSVEAISIEEKTPKVENVVEKPEVVDEIEVNIEDIEGEIAYYYSLTCGHCKTVNKFLEENDIASKVDFVKKEVSQNAEYGKELGEAAQKCGMNPGSIGIPFLFAGGKCYMGGPDVQLFFRQVAGL